MSSGAEEFRERVKAKVLSINPGLEGDDLKAAVSNEWALFVRQRNPDDSFLRGDDRPTLHLEGGFESLTDWKVIVDAFIEKNPLYYDRAGIWSVWNHRRKAWEMIDEVDLLNSFDEASRKNTLRSSVRSEVIEALKRRARTNEPKKAPSTWVQFANEVIDVTTGERRLATSDYHLTNPLPWSLGESTDTPKIDDLLKSWAGENENTPDWRTLKSWAAYCCLQETPIHAVLIMYGSGSNGKSVFLHFLTQFLGSQNVTSTTLERLEKNRFEMFNLRHKLMASVGETEVAVIERSGPLKSISGGDRVILEAKGKGAFSETLYAKLVISSNAIPSTRDRTDGFYRRTLVVDFPNRFSGNKDPLKELPEEEFKNLALWAATIELPRLIDERTITGQGTIEERRERYEARADILGRFIEENTERDDEGFAPLYELADAFKAYCQDRGHRTMSPNEFGQQMKQKGHEKSRKRVPYRENAIWGYEGIRVKVSAHFTQLPIENRVECVDTLTQVKNLWNNKQKWKGQPAPIETIQKLVPEATDEKIAHWEEKGEIIITTPGWVLPL